MHRSFRTASLLAVSILMCIATVFAAPRPHTLDDVIISESFDTTPPGQLPPGWTQVDMDSGYGDDQPFHGGRTIWQTIDRYGWSTHTGPRTAINAANANGMLRNNDWLILPHLDILAAPISFSFWCSSQDAANLESFEVRVSTTDARPASFVHLIDSVANTPHMWTQYPYDLSDYAGAPFYVAIRYISLFKYAFKVDDVQLTATIPYGAMDGLVQNAMTLQPLDNVTVSVIGTNLTTTTNSSGIYWFDQVPAGTRSVRFTRAQFDTLLQSNVIIQPQDTLELDVSMDPAAAASVHPALPCEFSFAGNFPNPFNSRTEFRFTLPNTSSVHLTLFNVNGQEVAHIFDGALAAGNHAVPFDAAGLSSGVYFARLNASGNSAMHKIMLLK